MSPARLERSVARRVGPRAVRWADIGAMVEVYARARALRLETGATYDVDHIIPLYGSLVSGLHVAANLQPLEVGKNRRKGKSFDQASFDHVDKAAMRQTLPR
jgi:hypothetical protein